jgi:hypothetical protein
MTSGPMDARIHASLLMRLGLPLPLSSCGPVCSRGSCRLECTVLRGTRRRGLAQRAEGEEMGRFVPWSLGWESPHGPRSPTLIMLGLVVLVVLAIMAEIPLRASTAAPAWLHPEATDPTAGSVRPPVGEPGALAAAKKRNRHRRNTSRTTATLLAAGDIASCSSNGDEATAKLLDGLAGTVVTLGDNAYESGTASEFTDCYDPTWGPAEGPHSPRRWQPRVSDQRRCWLLRLLRCGGGRSQEGVLQLEPRGVAHRGAQL